MSELIKYIRDENNHPYGVVVAKKINDDVFSIGWSLCHPKDQFDKELGKKIAFNRAEELKRILPPYPEQWREPGDRGIERPKCNILHDEILSMRDRANRYFKEAEFLY